MSFSSLPVVARTWQTINEYSPSKCTALPRYDCALVTNNASEQHWHHRPICSSFGNGNVSSVSVSNETAYYNRPSVTFYKVYLFYPSKIKPPQPVLLDLQLSSPLHSHKKAVKIDGYLNCLKTIHNRHSHKGCNKWQQQTLTQLILYEQNKEWQPR